MVKFKWLLNKILIQRIFLLSISGMIAYEILKGYFDYNKQVIEYMQSMPYRIENQPKTRESSRMKSNQRHSYDEAESSPRNQDATVAQKSTADE